MWLFQNRISESWDHLFGLDSVLDKANVRESSLQVWPSLPFRKFSPENFFPNYAAFCPKNFQSEWGGGGVLGSCSSRPSRGPYAYASIEDWRALSKSKFLWGSVDETGAQTRQKLKFKQSDCVVVTVVQVLPSKCKGSRYSPKWTWISWLPFLKKISLHVWNYFSCIHSTFLTLCSFLGTSDMKLTMSVHARGNCS